MALLAGAGGPIIPEYSRINVACQRLVVVGNTCFEDCKAMLAKYRDEVPLTKGGPDSMLMALCSSLS